MSNLWEQIRGNVKFLAVTIAIVVGIWLISKLIEHYLPGKRNVSPARRITIIGVCAAIATILHIFDFPLPFLAPFFYKLDFSEVPVMLCGFYLGPTAAVACEAVKILLKLLLKSTSTVFVGDFANFVVGCSMVIPAALIYRLHRTKGGAVAGLLTGTLVMTAFGSLFNGIYLLPKFAELYGTSLEELVSIGTAINASIQSVTTLVVFAVVPLNLIKGLAVSLLTLLLYKHVARPLFGRE